jgi:ADP-ribose pyrophosphatase YjhB (NUDIX family)
MVFSWDWKAQPPMEEIAQALPGQPHMKMVRDTGGDCYACVVSAWALPAVTKQCDNASVGVMIQQDGRWLFFERATFPVGIAPCAGHVFDEHESYQDAAVAEVAEELGLAVKELQLTGVGGWRPNCCRREPGPQGTGHLWNVYTASVSGKLRPSPREARNVRWLEAEDMQHLAGRTAAYARSEMSSTMFAALPGIEPVWVSFLVALGMVSMRYSDLALIEQVAASRSPW